MNHYLVCLAVFIGLCVIAGVVILIKICIKPKLSQAISDESKDLMTPLRLSKTDSQQNIYMYNPAIISHNNSILIVSRLSGHVDSSREQQCKNHKMEANYMPDVDEYFSIFKDNIYSASGLLSWMIDEPNTMKIFSPKISPSNLCNIKYPGFEDPRLFGFRGVPWVICYFRGGNYRGDLECNHKVIIFCIYDIDNPIILNYPNRNKVEKNWMPFEYDNELYAVYSIFPHCILHINTITGECKKAFLTESKKPDFGYTSGVGGGSPPVLTDIQGKQCYLSMGHTRGRLPLTRKNFFYTFEMHPPFKIIACGREFNVDFKYKDIEFGCGLIAYENYILISLGIDDCYGKIVRYDKDEVYKLLSS